MGRTSHLPATSAARNSANPSAIGSSVNAIQTRYANAASDSSPSRAYAGWRMMWCMPQQSVRHDGARANASGTGTAWYGTSNALARCHVSLSYTTHTPMITLATAGPLDAPTPFEGGVAKRADTIKGLPTHDLTDVRDFLAERERKGVGCNV